MQFLKKLNGYKTYAVAVVTVLYAVLYYGVSQHDWGTAFSLIFGSTGLAALRHGVAQAQNQPKV